MSLWIDDIFLGELMDGCVLCCVVLCCGDE
jgi:hypothetical protein